MFGGMKICLAGQLDEIRRAGLEKPERVITSPQGSRIKVSTGQSVVNMCANNYLGLGNHPEVVKAARDSYDQWGFGLGSVRFICGTQQIHKDLEAAVTRFLGTEDTIIYSSCFDANGGLFETLLGPEDVIISDQLNHASIIDGVRLCKAERLRFNNSDMADLEEKLKSAKSSRFRLIATDGVFSMDGYVAKLDEICDLADKYDALVMIDDCHASGVIGTTGRGTPEYRGVMGRVDIITGTFGKALGGARAVPVLEHPGAGDCRRIAKGVGTARPLDRTGGPPPFEHAVLSRADCRDRPDGPAGRPSDYADHAWRRGPGPGDGPPDARKGGLRHRLFVPGGAAGQGPDSNTGLRCPYPRRPGFRGREVRRGRPRVETMSPIGAMPARLCFSTGERPDRVFAWPRMSI